jgi:hypothetical protein
MATSALDQPTGARLPRTHVWPAAIGAGQLAGLLMAVVLIAVFMIFLHHSLFFPVQLIGSLFLGEAHLREGFDGSSFFLGLVAHQLGPSLFWSLIFGAVVATERRRSTLADLVLLGFFLGGLSQVFDVYVVMPAFQHALNGHNLWVKNVPRFWDWAAHFAYGIALGLAYGALRVADRTSPAPRQPLYGTNS